MSIRALRLLPAFGLLCGIAIVACISVLPMHRRAVAPASGAGLGSSEPVALSEDGNAARIAAATAPTVRGESRLDAFDPAEARARIDAHIATLERRFAAEPLDLAWAHREERALQAFFAADALAAQGLPVPERLQTVCRSATCRISARFSDAVEAEMTTQRLAMHVASRLPYGAVMPYPLADGRIQVEAWYSATRIAL
jgi:hypothetical protein